LDHFTPIGIVIPDLFLNVILNCVTQRDPAVPTNSCVPFGSGIDVPGATVPAGMLRIDLSG
jgi:hypothetical protein